MNAMRGERVPRPAAVVVPAPTSVAPEPGTISAALPVDHATPAADNTARTVSAAEPTERVVPLAANTAAFKVAAPVERVLPAAANCDLTVSAPEPTD